MNKKKIIILISILIFIVGVVFGTILFIKKKDSKNDKLDDVVASIITLDINPSMKLELNKDNIVVNAIALNDDANELIKENYRGMLFKNVIKNITNVIKDKDYAKEELVILLGVYGEIETDNVKEIVGKELKNKEINYNIIVPVITESSSAMAEEYNITESKASYIEEVINKYSDLKPEDIKDLGIKEIINKTKELDNDKEETSSTDTGTGGGSGSLFKCDNVTRVLTNEEAGKKVAGLKGATVFSGGYCDILPPESVSVLTDAGTCAYRVTLEYRTERCVYYIGVETGDIIGSPECTSRQINLGDAQCIIMGNMGLTKREMFYESNVRDTGSEFIMDVEDVYGTPDAEGKRYIYEYHVSKSTGQITEKKQIGVLQ